MWICHCFVLFFFRNNMIKTKIDLRNTKCLNLQLGLKEYIPGVGNFHSHSVLHDFLNCITDVFQIPVWNSLVHRKIQHMIYEVFWIVRKQNVIFLLAKGIICTSGADGWRAHKLCRCWFSIWYISRHRRWFVRGTASWGGHSHSSANFCLRQQTRINRFPCLDFFSCLGSICLVCFTLLCSKNSAKLCCSFVCLYTFFFQCFYNLIWIVL